MNLSSKEGNVQIDSEAKMELKKQNGFLEIIGIGKTGKIRITLSKQEQKKLIKFLKK